VQGLPHQLEHVGAVERLLQGHPFVLDNCKGIHSFYNGNTDK
jgi:hypothetical protein